MEESAVDYEYKFIVKFVSFYWQVFRKFLHAHDRIWYPQNLTEYFLVEIFFQWKFMILRINFTRI